MLFNNLKLFLLINLTMTEIASGKIIGTQNLFWRNLFTPEKNFKTKDELKKGEQNSV